MKIVRQRNSNFSMHVETVAMHQRESGWCASLLEHIVFKDCLMSSLSCCDGHL